MLNILIYKLKKPYHFIKTGLLNALPAMIYFLMPQRNLKIITITGTDGKTTTSNMLYHLLSSAKIPTALLSTVNAKVGSELIDTGFHVTSPQPWQLYKFMRKIVQQNITHLVLEVTSHGSYQFRDFGICPHLSGITNIAHEHLDYHLNYYEYALAKAKILNKAKICYLNKDDQSFSTLTKMIDKNKYKTYSLTELKTNLDSQIYTTILQKFPESYNQANATLATHLALNLGLSTDQITTGLESFSGVAGRMQQIPNNLGIQIIVDFAHTPQAVEAVLSNLKKNSSGGKIIAVLGSAGLRDVSKRPVMGKIVAQLADAVIFTAEDPRVENVYSIIDQMKSQIELDHAKIQTIKDRYLAIKTALTMASAGDSVVILGKGHEQSMCFGTQEVEWSDQKAVAQILKKN